MTCNDVALFDVREEFISHNEAADKCVALTHFPTSTATATVVAVIATVAVAIIRGNSLTVHFNEF